MIDKLEMFITLAREGHFGRASEVVGITQPSFSAAIRQLEDTLGVQLVRRGSRYQGLTHEGERVLEWALRIVGDARTMRAELRSLHQGLGGQLRLGVIPTAVPIASALIDRLLETQPALAVRNNVTSTDEILRQLELMELEAGIIYQSELTPNFEQHPLYTERLLLLTHADDPLAAKEDLGWEDLRETPLCLLSSNMRNRMIVSSHLAAAGRLAPPRIESNSMLQIISHVRTGRWASVIPDCLAALVAGIPDLRCQPLPGEGAQVALVIPARKPRLPMIEELLTKARKQFGA